MFGLDKAQVPGPLQLRQERGLVEDGCCAAPIPLGLGDKGVPPPLILQAQGPKRLNSTPPAPRILGSSLKLFYILILYFNYSHPHNSQSRALPFQHLKRFDIPAFFPWKQQVLTGHVVGATACMPQVDRGRPRMKGGGVGRPECSHLRKEEFNPE